MGSVESAYSCDECNVGDSVTTPNGTTTDEASCFVGNTCDAGLDEGVEPGAPSFSKAS